MISAEALVRVNPSKPHTSILPYLKVEQAKKDSQTEKEAEHKAEATNDTAHEETYAEAVRKIVTGME